MSGELNNVDSELLFKIREWEKDGTDGVVKGLIEVRDSQVAEKIRKENVELNLITGNFFTFRNVLISTLAEIAEIEGVVSIELSKRTRPH